MEGYSQAIKDAGQSLGHGDQLGGGAACFSPALPPPPAMLDNAFTFVYGVHVAKDKGEHMTDFSDLPLFRSTDPQGSRNGARHIRPKAGSQMHSLLIAYMGSPVYGLTDEEACEIRGIHHGWKRCADLRRHGLIAPNGQMRPTSSGVMAMVCCITDKGMEVVK